MQKALKKNGKGLGDIPSSFFDDRKTPKEGQECKKRNFELPKGQDINNLVGYKPYRTVEPEKVRETYKSAEKNKRMILNEFSKMLDSPLIVD